MRRADARRGPRTPEKVVQQQVVRLLQSIGAQVYVLGTVRPRGDYRGTCQTAGVPDVWCFLPAHPTFTEQPDRVRGLWVECKAVGARRSEAQEYFRARCEASRVNYVCGGVDDVLAWLEERAWVRREGLAWYRIGQATVAK